MKFKIDKKKLDKQLSTPFWIILIFCLGLLLASNQVRFYGGVCPYSTCSGLNGSFGDDGTFDVYGETATNLVLAPAGLLINDTINYFNDYETNTYNSYTLGYFQHITFDNKDEEFVRVADKDAKTERKIMAPEKHLYTSFIIIKLIILINLILWIPLGWLFYKFIKKHNKYKYHILIGFALIVLFLRIFTWYGWLSQSTSEVWLF